MNRTQHEIVVVDGRPKLRSSIDDPTCRDRGYETNRIYQEHGLPSDFEEYLLALIDQHDAHLAKDVGRKWLELSA